MKTENPLRRTRPAGAFYLLAALAMATPLAGQPHDKAVSDQDWIRQMKHWAGTVAQQYAQLAHPAAPPAPPPAPVQISELRMLSGSGSFLGVGVAEVDSARARALKLSEERGVEITKVEPDSPADKAGLKTGDVVLEYSGQRVEGTEQFIRLVRETPPGRSVKLTVLRNGATQSLTATIGKRKGGLASREWSVHVSPPHIRVDPPHVWMPDIPRPNMAWRSGMLGVEAEALESQLAQFFGVKEGVLVRSVVKGTPAEKAGIRAGDVIIKVEGTAVSSPRQLTRALQSAGPNKPFPITIIRDRKEMTLQVTLEDEKSGQSTIRQVHTRL